MARAPGWEDRRTRKVPVGCTMSSASAVSRVTAKPQMACGSVASHILPTCTQDGVNIQVMKGTASRPDPSPRDAYGLSAFRDSNGPAQDVPV